MQRCVNHPYAEAVPNRHYQIPQPSFRRQPESMPAASITASPNRHSGASRNPCLPASSPPPSTVIPAPAGIHACRLHCRLPQPSFRRKPESMPTGLIADSLNRHSGASRNPCLPPPLPPPSTVIPAPAGIHACRLHYRLPQPSFRRKPESMPAGPIADSLNRHSGASRNPGRAATFTVIPAQAGIYACRLHYRPPQPSSRRPGTRPRLPGHY